MSGRVHNTTYGDEYESIDLDDLTEDMEVVYVNGDFARIRDRGTHERGDLYHIRGMNMAEQKVRGTTREFKEQVAMANESAFRRELEQMKRALDAKRQQQAQKYRELVRAFGGKTYKTRSGEVKEYKITPYGVQGKGGRFVKQKRR